MTPAELEAHLNRVLDDHQFWIDKVHLASDFVYGDPTRCLICWRKLADDEPRYLVMGSTQPRNGGKFPLSSIVCTDLEACIFRKAVRDA